MVTYSRNSVGKLFVLFKFFIIALFVLPLTACTPLESVSEAKFQSTLESKGYQIVDITSQYAQFSHIKKALGTEKDGVHIEFFEIDSNDNAVAMFNGNKDRVEKFKSSGAVQSSSNASNYHKYALTTSEKFYTVFRVDNTLIYAYSDKKDKDALQAIMTEWGY